MKATIKHEASRISTWGLAALALIAEVGPQIKSVLPPHAGVIAAAAIAVAKAVIQGKK